MRYETLRRLFITTLSVCILFLLIFTYMFAVKPRFQGYVIQKQMEAKDIVLLNIISEVQQKGYVEIRVGEDKSLILIPYIEPEMQQQAAIENISS